MSNKSQNKSSKDPSFKIRGVANTDKKKGSPHVDAVQKSRTNPDDVGFGDLADDAPSKLERLKEVWGAASEDYANKPRPLVEVVFSWLSTEFIGLKKQARKIAAGLTSVFKSKNQGQRSDEQSLSPRKLALGVFVVVAILMTAGIANKNSNDEAILGAKKLSVSEEADYEVLVPSNEEASNTEQYDATSGIVTFEDMIDDGGIVVTQQEIPETILKDDEQSFEDFVNSLPGAVSSTRLESSKGVFYVSDYENGVQTVVLKTETLLVFITSNQTYDEAAWITYIDSLN